MNTSEAIKLAKQRVKLIHLGTNRYQVHHWSISCNAWSGSHLENRRNALKAVFEERITAALEALGWSNIDAHIAANHYVQASYPHEDWQSCVRNEIAANKLAESNAA